MYLHKYYSGTDYFITYIHTYSKAVIFSRFRTIVKKPISLLKAHNIIPEDTHVPKRLFSYLKPKPKNLPILDEFTDEDSIVHIHEIIFKHYLGI